MFGFVAAGGGTLGVLLGGILTDVARLALDLPRQRADRRSPSASLALRVLPARRGRAAGGRLDVAGAVTVTAALMLAVYAIVNGNQAGWTSAQTLGLLAGAVALLAAFLVVESRVRSPLMPLGLFRLRNLATANVVGVLWAARCSRGSSSRRSTCSSCSATARCRSGSRSCRRT